MLALEIVLESVLLGNTQRRTILHKTSVLSGLEDLLKVLE